MAFFFGWPKKKADKLVRTENSQPEDNWFRLNCKLKRIHLANWETAEEELSRMLTVDDTEQEETYVSASPTTDISLPRKRPRVLLPKRSLTLPSINLNDIAEACLDNQNNNDINMASTSNANGPNIFYQIESVPQIDVIPPVVQDHPAKEETKFDTIIATLSTVKENQNKIMLQMAKFETMIDQAMTKMKSTELCTCSGKNSASSVTVKAFNQIEKLEDLETLEEKLKVKRIFQEYIEKMSFICGKTGKQKGIDVSYMLVDQFFDRKFMVLCSWAGGARDETKEKIAFKFYKNTIKLFFELVHLADSEFTLADCEVFFKNVIRNAMKRTESSSRASKSKKRPSKLLYKKVAQNKKTDIQDGATENSAKGVQIIEEYEPQVIVVSENIPPNFELYEDR